jgi:hypothetical protein
MPDSDRMLDPRSTQAPTVAPDVLQEGGKQVFAQRQANDAITARPLAQRLVPLPPLVDLGEQIVGSSHEFLLGYPTSMDRVSGPAATIVTVAGPGAVTADWQAMHMLMPLSANPRPLRVRFAPSETGAVEATLRFTATWHDGHMETSEVRVTGRARTLEDAPLRQGKSAADRGAEAVSQTQALTAVAEGSALMTHKAEGPMGFGLAIDKAESDAKSKVAYVGAQQQDAIARVKGEAARFTARPPARPVWLSLAKAAMEISLEALPVPLAGLLGKELGNLVRDAGEDLAKKLETETFLAFAEETIKYSGKHAVEAMGDGEAESGGAEGEAGRTHEGAKSSNDFFQRQLTASEQFVTSEQDRLSSMAMFAKARAQLHPHQAEGEMRAMANAMHLLGGSAMTAQLSATTQAWAAFKARAQVGAKDVPLRRSDAHATGAAPSISVTDLESEGSVRQRRDGVLDVDRARHVDGVLEVTAVGGRGGDVRVIGARIDGIARDSAARFLTMDLATLQNPMRITVAGGAGTTIQRDEAGRVRVHGFTGELAPGTYTDEAQATLEAERIVAMVCSKTLSGWGVRAVGNNDDGKE